jgi:hypothetical protein
MATVFQYFVYCPMGREAEVFANSNFRLTVVGQGPLTDLRNGETLDGQVPY